MRGSYTAGVLDAFLEWGWSADYVVGVSAGANNGASYVSKQKGRALRTNTTYIRDKRYISVRNYLKTGSLFGMDFLFKDLPDRLEPFDYDAFQANHCKFTVGVTNTATGKAEYFGKELLTSNCDLLRASSSLPLLSQPVMLGGKLYLDGGLADPIPVAKALSDGCSKVVTVLTRERGFIKKPQRFHGVYRMALKEYPAVAEALENRHIHYNQTLKCLNQLEKEGCAFIIAPSVPLGFGRLEKDTKKLVWAYRLGRGDGLTFLKKYRAAL